MLFKDFGSFRYSYRINCDHRIWFFEKNYPRHKCRLLIVNLRSKLPWISFQTSFDVWLEEWYKCNAVYVWMYNPCDSHYQHTMTHIIVLYLFFFYPCDFKNNRHSVVVLHSFLCCSGYWRILSYFRSNISCQFNIYWLVLIWKSCDSMVSWLFWLDELTTTENTLTYLSALCLSPQKFCMSIVFSFSC